MVSKVKAQSKSNKTRQRDFKAGKRADGFVRLEVWVREEDYETIAKTIRSLTTRNR